MVDVIRKMFGKDADEKYEFTEAESTHEFVETEESRAMGPIGERKRISGKIYKLVENKGYGFISSHDIPFTRIFFHWSQLAPDTTNFTKLSKGMKVEFVPIEYTERGWQALKIRVLPGQSLTFLEKYRECKTWYEKVMVLEVYHLTGKHRYKDWSVSKTAAYFEISVGLASENLKLAKAIHDNPKLVDLQYRKDALKKL